MDVATPSADTATRRNGARVAATALGLGWLVLILARCCGNGFSGL